MIASELINPMLPVLKPTDRVSTALEWMEEFHLQHLPVVENNHFKGLVIEDRLLDTPNSSSIVADTFLDHEGFFASEDQHIYELLRIINQQEPVTSILPVMHQDSSWAGSILVSELLSRFSQLLGAQEKGAILVLRIAQRDYSLSEVSRLVESNGAKVISSYYSTVALAGLAEEHSLLTLKLNRTDIAPIVATLERFGYIIEEAHSNDPIDSMDQERLDMLLRYLAT
jgi:acetoin utilization protein AcuB